MLSDDDLNAPAVVRYSGKPLGHDADKATEEKEFLTLREALAWFEEQLRADRTFLVFSVDPLREREPFFDYYGLGEEMRRRGFDPIARTRPQSDMTY